MYLKHFFCVYDAKWELILLVFEFLWTVYTKRLKFSHYTEVFAKLFIFITVISRGLGKIN